jgi:carotenoid cleavage dioxygenase-like enzyme
VPLPGPRLPHDMAFSEHYAIFNDFPVFWDPTLLEKGIHRPRFYADLPSRFAVLPRRGQAGEVRWFEAAPTYVLHFINAFEQGDGFHQADPMPRPDPADGPWGPLKKMVDLNAMGCRPWRWRFDLRTGKTREEPLADGCCEFPTIHGRFGGRAYRYTVAMTGKPGWFLFDGMRRLDLHTGAHQDFRFPEGVYASESPIAPRGPREDDAWVVTFVSDLPHDRSECWIFDAAHISAGPLARVALPERISSGTHAHWAPAEALR